jgi:hypothetical protein
MDVASRTPIDGSPALLVAVIVEGPDDCAVYVGAVPEVPTGELDHSQFLELGSIDVYTSGGYVFVWDRGHDEVALPGPPDGTGGPTLSGTRPSRTRAARRGQGHLAGRHGPLGGQRR